VNRLESAIYGVLKRNPRLKLWVRNCYQALFDVVPVPAQRNAYPIVAREGYFFGFHDHTPFSPDNTMLIGCGYDRDVPLRMPLPEDVLDVGFFDGDDLTDWHALVQTRAWNWHQGCKAQWLGTANAIVCNDREDGTAVARIAPVDGSSVRTVPRAVGSVSADGRWGVSYGFARVEHYMPGYGYLNLDDDVEQGNPRPEDDGMYAVDMQTGQVRFLFSVAHMASLIRDEPTMQDTFHFFSHTVFSPAGNRFAFLHRWIRGDRSKRWSRLVTADVDGGDIHVFRHREMASHLAWRNANELLVYCRTAEGDDGYVLFDDRDPDAWERVGTGAFNSDGHPSFAPGGDWFVTDTYPDRFRVQTLNLFHMDTGTRYEIARVKTYRKFASLHADRHWSCDLHPRMDRQGRYACFDATYTGTRALCTIDFARPLSAPADVQALRHSTARTEGA